MPVSQASSLPENVRVRSHVLRLWLASQKRSMDWKWRIWWPFAKKDSKHLYVSNSSMRLKTKILLCKKHHDEFPSVSSPLLLVLILVHLWWVLVRDRSTPDPGCDYAASSLELPQKVQGLGRMAQLEIWCETALLKKKKKKKQEPSLTRHKCVSC